MVQILKILSYLGISQNTGTLTIVGVSFYYIFLNKEYRFFYVILCYNKKDKKRKLYNKNIKRNKKIICINDADINIDFEKARDEINRKLETVFPNKSSFES